ncbi:hypothetical protein [Cystobacter ferrugineus]|uniref:DUF5050 domain-containing protein n=1 Tax=Cystobacter ferrugineus TaxID=83449 RepID=A0A1L9BE00_9BACT|nr:hypothetical protein [Cystobacter ferrugineus]OJH40481.1 hypothetical protein BON30_15855 [Cystobacter ferrugineus]
MSYLLSRWLAAPATALRAVLVLGLAASTLAACNDSAPPINDTPTLSSVANQSITAGSSTGDLAFTVGDVETAADRLTITATSSNTDLVPNGPSNLVLGGSGSSRTLNVVPAAGASGSTTITLSVSDGSATTSTTFVVDVTRLASLYVDSSGGKVYYSTRGNSIYVANLDGSNATTLVTNQTTVHGIAIDVTAGRLYWADWLAGVLRSANLADGSDSQDVNSGSSRNLGLAWMPAP